MSVITAARPAASRNAALVRLTVSELKLLLRERIRLFFGVGFPLILLIIFGSIPRLTGRARPSAATPRWTLYPHPDRVLAGLDLTAEQSAIEASERELRAIDVASEGM